jgi:SAM-dependent methyltransferase
MSFADRIQRFNRDRKWRIFTEEFQPRSHLRILDVGFTDKEFTVSDNYLEKHYPYPNMITALSIDEPRHFRERYPEVTALAYDGKHIPFDDDSFDVCWSNAVIEHVGDSAAQLQFLKELMRTAKAVFLTTPNRYFPVEVHTRTPLLHFLPKSTFDRYLRLVRKPWATGNYMSLLSRSDIKTLLDLAGAKHRRIYSNRLFGFVLDFVIVIKKSEV